MRVPRALLVVAAVLAVATAAAQASLESRRAEVFAAERAFARSLAERMSAADYFRQPPDVLRGDKARIAQIENLLNEKLERWTALESIDRR